MGKYEDSTKILLSYFTLPAWTDANIITQPANYSGAIATNTYVRVSVIQSRPGQLYSKTDIVSGQLIIEIFTPIGEGPATAQQIADVLDALLVGKIKNSSTGYVQTGLSFLTSYGQDKANPSLFRHIYNIPFTYSGK